MALRRRRRCIPGGPPGPGGAYNGQQMCLTVEPWREAPCLNLDKQTDGRGWTRTSVSGPPQIVIVIL